MTRRSRLLRLPLALTLAATLSLAACGDDEEPSADASPTPSETSSQTGSEAPSESPSEEPSGQSVDITIKGDDVTPIAQQLDLKVGDTLTLNVTSDRPGELHVHSAPEQEKEFEAGTTTIELTFDKPGQVDVEEHESDSLILRLLVS